jgi:osmoprotectant transport system ATP-binding protein
VLYRQNDCLKSCMEPVPQRNRTMIQFQGVSRRFNGVVALEPTDLSFEERKTTVLIGPSGCGKSTILRLIIGLLEPSSGRIQIDGDIITPENLLQVRRRMGYVIQEGGLFPHLTARQNILLMANQLGRKGPEMQVRIEELCELTRLPNDSLSHYPGELSGGQRQRVSLIRALMLQPDVLLLDEPLAALDPMVRATLQTELHNIFQHLNQTIVLVTHDMAEAAYLGDEIVLLRQGGIVQKGTFADLRDRPADPFVSEFINAQRKLVLS